MPSLHADALVLHHCACVRSISSVSAAETEQLPLPLSSLFLFNGPFLWANLQNPVLKAGREEDRAQHDPVGSRRQDNSNKNSSKEHSISRPPWGGDLIMLLPDAAATFPHVAEIMPNPAERRCKKNVTTKVYRRP